MQWNLRNKKDVIFTTLVTAHFPMSPTFISLLSIYVCISRALHMHDEMLNDLPYMLVFNNLLLRQVFMHQTELVTCRLFAHELFTVALHGRNCLESLH